MRNTDILITAMVLSSVEDYKRRSQMKEEATKAGRKHMATTCGKYMAAEENWLRTSGYPEAIGLNGAYVADHLEGFEPPDDLVAALEDEEYLWENEEADEEAEETATVAAALEAELAELAAEQAELATKQAEAAELVELIAAELAKLKGDYKAIRILYGEEA